MTLIEMVRKARENGHIFVAVDYGGDAYSYLFEPHHFTFTWACKYDAWKKLGSYNLTCDWRDTLIEVSKIKEKG